MRHKMSTGAAALLCLSSYASIAAAQSTDALTLSYAQTSPAGVPGLTGIMLLIMGGALGLLAVNQLARRRQLGAAKALVCAMVALASGAGGIRLVADAHAATTDHEMTSLSGGVLTLGVGQSRVINTTAAPQRINGLQYKSGCALKAPAAPAAPTPCAVGDTLAPGLANACEIEVTCRCALAWSPNFYVDFSAGDAVTQGNYWSDANCTVPAGVLSRSWVYSPSGQANATSLCAANFGAAYSATASHGPDVFECVPPN